MAEEQKETLAEVMPDTIAPEAMARSAASLSRAS